MNHHYDKNLMSYQRNQHKLDLMQLNYAAPAPVQSDLPSSPAIWAGASGPAPAPQPSADRGHPGPVPAAVSRHRAVPGRRHRAGSEEAADQRAQFLALPGGKGGGPLQAHDAHESRHDAAHPLVLRETEIKFERGLLKGMQRANLMAPSPPFRGA